LDHHATDPYGLPLVVRVHRRAAGVSAPGRVGVPGTEVDPPPAAAELVARLGAIENETDEEAGECYGGEELARRPASPPDASVAVRRPPLHWADFGRTGLCNASRPARPASLLNKLPPPQKWQKCCYAFERPWLELTISIKINDEAKTIDERSEGRKVV
ncbi:hypothetical protein THAOC_11336, partial [Thalassiosira oceanica]